jgi:hypothetical protein
MSPVPEGAQRSDDGYYWWDGNAWQQIPEDERVSAADSPGTASEITMDELAQITTEDQLDDRIKPYFTPDPDMYPDDASEAEGTDVLSDEPAHDAAGGH